MIKTIKCGKTSIKISNNLKWAVEYKKQFGHDIVPDIMPILSAISEFVGEISDFSQIKNINGEILKNAMIELCSFQFVDFLHLVWALNKVTGEGMDDPDEWVEQFDEFPLDVIVPAVLEILGKGLVSTKNLKSLRETMTPKA